MNSESFQYTYRKTETIKKKTTIVPINNPNDYYKVYINHVDIHPSGYGELIFVYLDGIIDTFKANGNGGLKFYNYIKKEWNNQRFANYYSSEYLSENIKKISNATKNYTIDCLNIHGTNTWFWNTKNYGLKEIIIKEDSNWGGWRDITIFNNILPVVTTTKTPITTTTSYTRPLIYNYINKTIFNYIDVIRYNDINRTIYNFKDKIRYININKTNTIDKINAIDKIKYHYINKTLYNYADIIRYHYVNISIPNYIDKIVYYHVNRTLVNYIFKTHYINKTIYNYITETQYTNSSIIPYNISCNTTDITTRNDTFNDILSPLNIILFGIIGVLSSYIFYMHFKCNTVEDICDTYDKIKEIITCCFYTEEETTNKKKKEIEMTNETSNDDMYDDNIKEIETNVILDVIQTKEGTKTQYTRRVEV